jgi:hypothetical protein
MGRTRPYATHEIVLGYDFAGRLDQHFDDLERTSPNRD